MIDTIVYLVQWLIVVATSSVALGLMLWFLSLPWREVFTEWEPEPTPSWKANSPEEMWTNASWFVHFIVLLCFLVVAVVWAFAGVF